MDLTDLDLEDFEPIKIVAVDEENVGEPRDDSSRGAALYAIPFKLSRRPPSKWAEFFVPGWDRPSEFSTMHRPGIAMVIEDRIILDGTTIQEVEKYHRKTLILAVNQANEKYEQWASERRRDINARDQKRQSHQRTVQETARRIRFDDDQ